MNELDEIDKEIRRQYKELSRAYCVRLSEGDLTAFHDEKFMRELQSLEELIGL